MMKRRAMASDPTWDFQNPASKTRLLSVLRSETDEMFELASDPTNWHAPTACPGWELRDMIGHLLDAAESYLAGIDIARHGGAELKAVGVTSMAKASDEAARAFRSVPRDELLARLRDRTDRLNDEFESLTDAEWNGLMIPDIYMGPLPAMIVAAGRLGGSTVHLWDVREGLGIRHAIAGDAADLLVPFMFLLWWATADTSKVDAPYTIGIRTSGRNGGDTRIDITPKGLKFAPANIGDCPAILEFDPATLVLTAYNRINAGTIRGDHQLATNFRSLFVSI
jgi:uncharacterized protein (TIGR03083 family)